MANIKKPRLPKKLIRPFSTQDIQRMRMLTSGNRFADVRNRAVILLLLDTGIRLNELSHIQLKDIDFDRETVRIYGKGNKERMVRIGRNTQKALLRYLLARHDEYPCLWLNVSRRPISRDGIQTAVEKLCKSAEITNAKPGPHTFRHAAAIIFLRNGGDSSILQYMLGHSSFDMTRRYLSTLGERELVAAHKKANPVDNMKLQVILYYLPQHFLYFLPLPHGHGSFLPVCAYFFGGLDIEPGGLSFTKSMHCIDGNLNEKVVFP